MKLLKKLAFCGFSAVFALGSLAFAEESPTATGVAPTLITPIAHHASVVIDNETDRSFVCQMQSNVTATPSSPGAISAGLMGKIVFNWQGDEQRLKSDIHCVSAGDGETTAPAEITLAVKSTGCTLGVILADAIAMPIVGLANDLMGKVTPDAISCDSFDLVGRGNGYSVDTNMHYGNFNNYLFYFKLMQNS